MDKRKAWANARGQRHSSSFTCVPLPLLSLLICLLDVGEQTIASSNERIFSEKAFKAYLISVLYTLCVYELLCPENNKYNHSGRYR